ncbi:MAG TPA: hypothetical protein VHZ99_11925, partial [Steroidobacteraceae bacterium]|nr:hypothetical protein [Steroidobacteraceae bacterium]
MNRRGCQAIPLTSSCRFLFRQRPAAAGVLLGLAIGCRLTAAALALPLCLWLWLPPGRDARTGERLRHGLIFGATALVVSALCFMPVWRIYGFGFFTFFDNDGYPPLDVVLMRSTILVWGVVGAVALALVWIFLACYRRHGWGALREPGRRNVFVVALMAVILYLMAFLRLPDEAGYLVPLVPWALIATAIVAPPEAIAALAVALMMSPWIGFAHAWPVLEGPMVEDHRVRESQDAATRAVID